MYNILVCDDEKEIADAIELYLQREGFNILKANDGKEKEKATPKRVNKIGRNEPCPCGSGKKYKNCCGKNA